MSLDKTKLENVRPCSDGWNAGCPVCARNGSDSKKVHLKIWRSNGAFSCAVFPHDKEHNKQIYAIAGTGGSGAYEPEPVSVKQIELQKTWPVDVLSNLVKDHSYWNGRGISNETVEYFRGGMAVSGQMKGRYVFPVFDMDNDEKIIGFAGRRTDGVKDMSWKILGSRSSFVFGDVDEIESTRRVILVESIGDLLALREHGVKDVLCIFGVSISQVLLAKIIALNPNSIVISTNRDVEKLIAGVKRHVGQESAEKIYVTLSKFFDDNVVSILFPPEREGVKDWGNCNEEDIRKAFLEKS